MDVPYKWFIAALLAVSMASPALAQPAPSCSGNLVVTMPDGSKKCLSELPVSSRVVPVWNRTVEDLVRQNFLYVVAQGTTPGCTAIGFAHPTSSSEMLLEPGPISRAIGQCRAGGCPCEVSINSGKIEARWMGAASVDLAQPGGSASGTAGPVASAAASLPIAQPSPSGASASRPGSQVARTPPAPQTVDVVLEGGTRLIGRFVQDPTTRLYSGQGRIQWSNGDVYEGGVMAGKRHGQGEINWASGHRYRGDWVEDRASGRGTMRFADGNEWEGEVEDGQPEGSGVMRYASGDSYSGQVRQGLPQGRGVYTSAGGDALDGTWNRGVAFGPGVKVFARGGRYEGEFLDGQPHGKGRLVNAAGDEYVGPMVAGQPDGASGRYRWATGQTYEGPWVKGAATGRGRMAFSNGNVFVGDLVDGVPQGRGTFTYGSGDVYEGAVSQGRPDGEGRYAWKNGDAYEGSWKNGLKDGRGVMRWAGGDRWEGVYAEDRQTSEGRLVPHSPSTMGATAVATAGTPTAQAGSPSVSGAARADRNPPPPTVSPEQRVPGSDAPGQQLERARLADEQRAAEERRLAEERRRAEEQRLAEERAQAERAQREAQQRETLIAQARQREQEAEAFRKELARVREELASAQQSLQTERGRQQALSLPSRRKALVIGNDSYTKVARLQTAGADARSISAALRDMGFEVQEHLDLAERPMRQALRDFKVKVQSGDDVVFFFAGHGVQIGGINYLLPIDIHGNSEEQVRDEAIQLQRVLDDMREKGAGFMLAVVDACRDNPFVGPGRSIGGRGLAPTTAATGQMIIFSAGAGQQALDRLDNSDTSSNGVFTRVFLREMVKPGLPVDRVLRNVRQEVVRLARSVGKEQVPALYDQALGDFIFKP